MTTLESANKAVKGRMRWLGFALVLVTAAFAAREILSVLPREPRYIVKNEFGDGDNLGFLVIKSACGETKVGRLGEGQSARVSLRPQPDCDYQIGYGKVSGRELLRVYEIAKEQRKDVIITIVFEGWPELDVR